MYRVMIKQDFEFDTFHGEYSGLKHETREAAEKELKQAEKFVKDDATVDYCYIEEV